EVLPNDDELAARVEVDDVTGDHSCIDDFADDTGLARPGAVIPHVNLLRADRDLPPVPLEDVRDAHEPRYELRLRVLVHVRRRSELLDAAFVENSQSIAHRERLFL